MICMSHLAQCIPRAAIFSGLSFNQTPVSAVRIVSTPNVLQVSITDCSRWQT